MYCNLLVWLKNQNLEAYVPGILQCYQLFNIAQWVNAWETKSGVRDSNPGLVQNWLAGLRLGFAAKEMIAMHMLMNSIIFNTTQISLTKLIYYLKKLLTLYPPSPPRAMSNNPLFLTTIRDVLAVLIIVIWFAIYLTLFKVVCKRRNTYKFHYKEMYN